MPVIRGLIRQQLVETPEKSDRQIAAGLGVSNKTVSDARNKMVDEGHLCNLHTSIGADGKEYPRQVERQAPAVSTPIPRLRDMKEEEEYTYSHIPSIEMRVPVPDRLTGVELLPN